MSHISFFSAGDILRILQPTSLRRGKPDLWELDAVRNLSLSECRRHTNNQRNHGGSVSSGCFEALDELLNLPYFDVLFRLVGLRCAHDGQRDATEVSRPWMKKKKDSSVRVGICVC